MGAAEAYTKVKSAVLDGDYDAAAAAVHKSKQFTKTMRTTAEEQETKQELAIKNPKGGVCTRGECCIVSYKGDDCQAVSNNMCKRAEAGDSLFWKNFMQFKTELQQDVVDSTFDDGRVKSVAVNRTVHVKAKWSGTNNAQSLEVQFCGRFTKFGNQGASVCFPKNVDGSAAGIPIGEFFSVPKGQCIRTADFADVIRKRVADTVNKAMLEAKRLAEAKAAANKRSGISEITEAVSRAIGGAFKGSLGGIVREDDELDESRVMSFIQESTTEDWENLLALTGSFKISYIAKAADFKGVSKVLDPKESEVSMLEQ